MAVVAMSGEEVISCLHTGKGRNTGGLLTDIDMVVTLETPLPIETDEGLFKMADEKHPTTELDQSFSRQLG
jgi:hypothetical protein